VETTLFSNLACLFKLFLCLSPPDFSRKQAVDLKPTIGDYLQLMKASVTVVLAKSML